MHLCTETYSQHSIQHKHRHRQIQHNSQHIIIPYHPFHIKYSCLDTRQAGCSQILLLPKNQQNTQAYKGKHVHVQHNHNNDDIFFMDTIVHEFLYRIFSCAKYRNTSTSTNNVHPHKTLWCFVSYSKIFT